MKGTFIVTMIVLCCSIGLADVPVTNSMVVRLDAASVVLDGNGLVVQMNDLSPSGVNDAVQNDPNHIPSLLPAAANGYPAIDFAGDGTSLNPAKALVIPANEADFAGDNFTWFIVYKLNDPSEYSGLMWSTYDMVDDLSQPWGVTAKFRTWGTLHGSNEVQTNVRNSTEDWRGQSAGAGNGLAGWNLSIGRWKDTSSTDGLIEHFMNPFTASRPTLLDALGAANAGSSDVVDPQPALHDHKGTVIGGTFNDSWDAPYVYQFLFGGQIAEIIIYNSALDDTDISSVAQYLKAKYNYGEEIWVPGGSYVAPLTDCTGIYAAGAQPVSDLNQDCKVDMLDFAVLADNWLDMNVF
jgi:hypothetical protein